jgi:hypothetical protein
MAIVPASPWLGGPAPGKPSIEVNGDRATWRPADDAARWWLVQTKFGEAWRSRLLPAKEKSIATGNAEVVAVRALDRAGNLGEVATSR